MEIEKIKPIPMEKLAKGLGFRDKIRYGLIYVRLSNSDVEEMKEVLKRETRKIIKELSEPKLKIIEIMENYLEDYIDGLSKKDAFKLYLAYLEVKEAIGFAQEKYTKLSFLTKMYQNYRKSGWNLKDQKTVKKVVKKVKKIKSAPAVKKATRTVAAKKAAVRKKAGSAKKVKSAAKKKVAKLKVAKKKAPTKRKASKKKR